MHSNQSPSASFWAGFLCLCLLMRHLSNRSRRDLNSLENHLKPETPLRSRFGVFILRKITDVCQIVRLNPDLLTESRKFGGMAKRILVVALFCFTFWISVNAAPLTSALTHVLSDLDVTGILVRLLSY